MAYSCVRVTFEIGHEASIRTKRTPEGFTHDWEVFVRGADNTDISHFVEKVVFHLHDTFLKPKRVFKEPPYSVKESGYAGFKLPIDIYFRNQDEPKKVRFNYDLNLQPSGPAISNVIREKYVFRNPDEDLRRRLIRGGGVGVVGSESGGHTTPSDKQNISSAVPIGNDDSSTAKPALPQVGGKSKPSGDSSKKHKIIKEHRPEEPRVSNPFHELFGPPIKTNKVSPDPKKTSQPSPKVSPVSKPSKPDKPSSDKLLSSSSKSSKHSGLKDSREGSDRNSSSKEEKKERSKDREKYKEKPPKRTSPPKSQPPKPTKEEGKKLPQDESKGKGDSKPHSDSSKSEKEKKKKDKKSRDEKSKKDKHKEHESKLSEKPEKSEKSTKESKEKEKESARKQEKDGSKEAEKSKEKDKSGGDGDKEHGRHKHKKKEKNKREDVNKERDKNLKKDRCSSSSESKKPGDTKDRDRNGVVAEAIKKRPNSPSLSPSPPDLPHEKPSPSPEKLPPQQSNKDKPKRPLTKLLAELTGHDSSDSNLSPPSPDDDSLDLPAPLLTKSTPPAENTSVKQEQVVKPVNVTESVNNISSTTQANNKLELGKSKPETVNQERSTLNKEANTKQKDKNASKRSKEKKENSGSTIKDDSGIKVDKESSKKRKRKSSSKGKEENEQGTPSAKVAKLEREPVRLDERNSNDIMVQNEIVPMQISKEELPIVTRDDLSITSAICETETPSASVPIPSASPPTLFSPDYVSQLKDLQRKIMTLEDNAELQRVVQVIAETGQYEITKKTFDFDLCALDRSTVKRLQDFFTTS